MLRYVVWCNGMVWKIFPESEKFGHSFCPSCDMAASQERDRHPGTWGLVYVTFCQSWFEKAFFFWGFGPSSSSSPNHFLILLGQFQWDPPDISRLRKPSAMGDPKTSHKEVRVETAGCGGGCVICGRGWWGRWGRWCPYGAPEVGKSWSCFVTKRES